MAQRNGKRPGTKPGTKSVQSPGNRPSKALAPTLQVTHPDSAAVDIGGKEHYAAVGAHLSDEPVRRFGCFTKELHAMVDWFTQCGVKIVAMESTGVYWIPLLEILEARGFQVLLVNPRYIKNVSGRKSDVLDCQWLQQLLTFGLLSGAFRPKEQVCVLRSYTRQRDRILGDQSRCIQHMQKALAQMNIQLTHAISDLAGATGQRIVRAIVAGERDTAVLAALKDSRIRASAQTIADSLQGNWRAEHLFALKQALHTFDFLAQQMAQCDEHIAQAMQQLQIEPGSPQPGKKKSRARNAPKFDVRDHLFKMCGVDLTRIDGINVSTALTVISEVGPDLSRFPSVKHFTSWLGLCPGTRISGGKVLGSASKRSPNRATQALKLAAAALRTSHSALGAYYRRLCARMDKPKAVTAAAHKLARTIYVMITKGEQYVDQAQQYYEERYRDRVVRNLRKRASELGMQLLPTAQPV